MPYELKKRGSGYVVSGPHGAKSKHGIPHARAVRQMRLLEAIEHDPGFKPHGSKARQARRRHARMN